MRLGDLDLLLKEMNNEKTKYTCQIDINQRASKEDVVNITLKAYRGLIFEMIKDLPTIEIPQWIPCSERLPEENGFYIVTLESMYVEYLFYEPKENEWYFVADGNENENTVWREKAKGVIAWIPLPSVWKGVIQ